MNTTAAASRPGRSGRPSAYAWYVVIVCMLAYVFSFIDRQVLVLMIEPIKRDLMLSDTQFSLLDRVRNFSSDLVTWADGKAQTLPE